MPERRTSCGVLVTDGSRVLLGHATRSPRWDIPKGLAEPGEAHADAAIRELHEETGLRANAAELCPLGTHAYLPGKDLALFALRREPMPDPAGLVCTTFIVRPDGDRFPEMDRFGVFAWKDALARVGKNMRRVLEGLLAEADGNRTHRPLSAGHWF